MAKKNYYLHSEKLEFLALKWAITEHFRDYLYYAPSFVVYTDNKPLTYVTSSAKSNATGHRWVAEIADSNFTVKYHLVIKTKLLIPCRECPWTSKNIFANVPPRQIRRPSKPSSKEWQHRQLEKLFGSTLLPPTWTSQIKRKLKVQHDRRSRQRLYTTYNETTVI